ncbi:MAG TPA: histidine kinase dimerization/phospho-acceptor domain-containing protein, partial [Candidatus Bathyarchaeia archaeon]|nr:histidine kinase dimerization/phospho-acceptor domain-containing protein [Candidatus Bathyarchaeia archaeon]
MSWSLLRAVRRSIALKLTLTLVGFVAISILAAGLYLNRALEAFAVESLETRLGALSAVLHDEARVALETGGRPAQDFVQRVAKPTGARVTLIAPDGRVIGESDRDLAGLSQLENHASRPEVQAALAGRRGRDLRRSATVAAPLLYVAAPVRDGDRVIGVLRLALPLSAVTASYATLHQVMLAGGAVALLVALGIGLFVAGRVTRPVVEMQSIARQMSEGSFLVRAPTRSTDEIGTLGRSLNVMAGRLREKIQDIEQEQAKITAILDGMVEGVIAVDGQEHILLMNERARTMFALGTARGDGKPFLEVIRNADLHEIFRSVHSGAGVAPDGAPVRREIVVSGPAPRILQVNAVRLAMGGEGPGTVMVLHDVTALRQLERVRTEFVANVSHELRTPLTAIQGYLETLLSGALEERDNARRFLEIVLRHSERLGRLLNDLTDLSNIELGKVTLRREPVRIDDVVASVLGIIAPRASASQVKVTADISPGLPAVSADRDRLAQILINLVDNAVKYTPGGGSVTVTAQAHDGAVEVAVADTGIGIPPADLPRITERFYRVDKARSREL